MEENNNLNNKPRIPLWFGIAAAVSFIPVLCWPWMITSSNLLEEPGDISKLLLITFPVYAVVSIYLAYRTIGTRTYLAVILLILLWLSFAAMWFL
ncbi:MAG TPA: hypothetical protein IAA88_03065 [Candidatus Avimuribaculum pullicola]|nr:hypothetical protein [Candidatus Avimuribaculum pullicola]